MKTTMKLVALAVAMAFAGSASAAMYCKNEKGHQLVWKVGMLTPILKNGRDPNKVPVDFDLRAERDVMCFVNGPLLTTFLPSIQGIPQISGIVSAPGNGDGLIFRGDMARFLIDNLPALSGAPATMEDYETAKP